MILYPIRYAKEGRKQGEFPVGNLDWQDGRLLLDVPDRKLRASLEEFFAQPVQVRVSRGNPETVLGHSWQELAPGSAPHFQEALRRLVRLDLMARAL